MYYGSSLVKYRGENTAGRFISYSETTGVSYKNFSLCFTSMLSLGHQQETRYDRTSIGSHILLNIVIVSDIK